MSLARRFAMRSKDHWERIYSTKATDAVSWYQEHAVSSLQLIRATGLPKDATIIDVGGGASTLVDDLLADGYSNLTVLDLSRAALSAARDRLGARAAAVAWLEADVTKIDLPRLEYDLWHDRAVFHFLTSREDRTAYVRAVVHSVKPGGHVIVATFAEDGPEKCSGLPVMRYSAPLLHSEFGESFTLLSHKAEEHRTPFGTIQKFVYCYCRKTVS
jgi:2-polyprenyl-3-methyl-5-hydroxy-6-metoxy-1,4-benzoquinol methylase